MRIENVIPSCTCVPVTTCHHVSQHISPWNASCRSWIMSPIAQCFVHAAASRDNGIKLAQLPSPDPSSWSQHNSFNFAAQCAAVQMGRALSSVHTVTQDIYKGGTPAHHIRCPLSWQTPRLIGDCKLLYSVSVSSFCLLLKAYTSSLV